MYVRINKTFSLVLYCYKFVNNLSSMKDSIDHLKIVAAKNAQRKTKKSPIDVVGKLVAKKSQQNLVRIAKESTFGTVRNALIRGLSCISLNPNISDLMERPTVSNDASSMRRDWEAIGRDMEGVLKTHFKVKKTSRK